MNLKSNRITIALGLAMFLVVGTGLGYWWGHSRQPSADVATAKEDRQVLYWYDPMAPDQRFDKPGKSPLMDMPLVPKYADEVANAGVRIDSGLQQNVGIRTAIVESGSLTMQLRVPATVGWDLRRETIVSTPVNAIVSRVFVRAPFEPVRRGQPLAAVLAPEWSSAIAEAGALEQARSGAARELRSAAQQRLRLLGLPGTGASRDGSITLSAPSNGVVSEVLAREGQSVAAGTPLFRVNGTDTLWLEAAIPQAGSAGIGAGTKVSATINAVPGETFDGEVETLLPQIDPASRTQRARIVLRNDGGKLVPGMFAELTLRAAEGQAVPLVPTEALIATGADSRVIVMDANGAFRPVRVQVGRSSNGRTEVLAGLEGGERVVTSGQFLIDSEASLSGALQRLEAPVRSTPTPTAVPPVPNMDHSTHPSYSTKPSAAAKPGQSNVLYWYDPMVPDKHFDKPGKSPYMDMPLVPKYADEVPFAESTMENLGASHEQHQAPAEDQP
jgi:membrane fusion protein, copper/silver efflux system